MAIIYLALGSNLHDPLQQLKKAVKTLHDSKTMKLIKCSSFYRTPPLGPQNQPDFINAVVKAETFLSPFELLEYTQSLEKQHQRIHYYHWGPRTLDIDILFYDRLRIQSQKLTLPHPEWDKREFVLVPLKEIESMARWPFAPLYTRNLWNCKVYSAVIASRRRSNPVRISSSRFVLDCRGAFAPRNDGIERAPRNDGCRKYCISK